MTVAHADGHEHGALTREGDLEAGEEHGHRGIVGHQKPIAVDRKREVPVADLERQPQRLLARLGVTASTGSGAASMTTYQPGPTCRIPPGPSTLPVGSASA